MSINILSRAGCGLALGMIAAVCSQATLAGQRTFDIRARIVEADGQPAAFARVSVVGAGNHFRKGLPADSSGRFHLSGLPVGRYEVRVQSIQTLATASRVVEIPTTGAPGEDSIQLSSGSAPEPTGYEAKELLAVPLSTGNFMDALPGLSEITRGETGGNIEGYGPFSPRGSLSFNSSGLRGQDNTFLIDGFDNNVRSV